MDAVSTITPVGPELPDLTDVVDVAGGPIVRAPDEKLDVIRSIPFFLVNASPLLILVTGVSTRSLILLAVTFWTRMFFITAGYHRYFAHRSYQLARAPQFVMALGGTTAAQKGPLWWAGYHRDHHRFADTERDIHSPQKGFWWSHVGWILCRKYTKTRTDHIKDFAAFAELRFLDKYQWISPWLLAAVCFLIDGWQGLVVGFLLSTVLLWHSTFFINSLAHVYGRRRYATEDTSRNSALLAVLTMGEGWHNNHHYYASSCRNGFFWWEWDPTYYILKALSAVGIVRGMKYPPRWALSANRVKDGSFDVGMFRLSWNRAARTLDAARAHFSADVSEGRSDGGEATDGVLIEVESSIWQRRAALESDVQSSMASAEALAMATRRANREVATKAS